MENRVSSDATLDIWLGTIARASVGQGESDPVSEQRPHIGLIGLAVMGENLALNIARNGFPLVVYNRTTLRTE